LARRGLKSAAAPVKLACRYEASGCTETACPANWNVLPVPVAAAAAIVWM